LAHLPLLPLTRSHTFIDENLRELVLGCLEIEDARKVSVQPDNMLYAVDVCVGGGGGEGKRCRELWALMQRAEKGLMA
jgi:hypothetical protein